MTKTRTYTCYVAGCDEPARDIGYACEKHQAEHRAKWKEEHTRKPGDKRGGWLIGDAFTIQMKGQWYHGKIVDMSDVSVADKHNYMLVKAELSKTVQGWDGKPKTYTWTHPEPIQTYKLRKP